MITVFNHETNDYVFLLRFIKWEAFQNETHLVYINCLNSPAI